MSMSDVPQLILLIVCNVKLDGRDFPDHWDAESAA
jgi:hypothetical protein